MGTLLWFGCITILTVQYFYATGATWPEAIIKSIRDWVPWVVLTPFVFLLCNRFRIGRRRFFIHVPIHLVASICCVVIAELFVVYAINPAVTKYVDTFWSEEELKSSRRPDLPAVGASATKKLGPRDFASRTIRKSRFWLPLYWVLVSIAHAILYYRRLEDREQRNLVLEQRLAEAHLNTLRSQLEPHFLFNALNAIATLVHRDPDKADAMIVRLSTLLRRFLDTRNTQVIPLASELEFLRAYLEIEKIRFDKRLQVEEEIETGTLFASIPVMLLQPLAENAVRHGIEPAGRPGTLTISVTTSDGRLIIKLIDDGIGLPSTDTNTGPLSLPKQRSHSVGVTNARERLAALYGEDGYLFTIEPNPEGQGTVVALDIPFREENTTVEEDHS